LLIYNFQKKEELGKKLILMKEQMHKIYNYGIANVMPFINDKVNFDLEDNDDRVKYNRYVDFYISVLEALVALKKDFDSAEDMYYFAMHVEEQIENNVFIMNYKNESFTEEYLLEYQSLSEEFQEMYESYFKYAQARAKKLELI
jgi:hypothetical protein